MMMTAKPRQRSSLLKNLGGIIESSSASPLNDRFCLAWHVLARMFVPLHLPRIQGLEGQAGVRLDHRSLVGPSLGTGNSRRDARGLSLDSCAVCSWRVHRKLPTMRCWNSTDPQIHDEEDNPVPHRKRYRCPLEQKQGSRGDSSSYQSSLKPIG